MSRNRDSRLKTRSKAVISWNGFFQRLSSLWILALLSTAVISQVQAMKHAFHINRTTHQLIGPIGEPFGFTAHGHFELKVFDFELSVRYNATMKMLLKEYKKQTKKGKKSKIDPSIIEKVQQQQQEILNSVEAGFLLQRYDNLASFHQYLNVLRANATLCSFQHFIPPNQRLLNEGGMDDFVPNPNDFDDGVSPYDDDDGSYGDDFMPPRTLTDDWDPTNGDNDRPMTYSTAKDGIFFSMQSKSRTWKPNTPSIQYRFQPGEEGLYILLYQICPPRDDIVSTFELDFHFDNPHSYLSAGELHLPLLYLLFAVSYFLCFAIWYSNIRSIQRGHRGHFSKSNASSPPVIYPIHQIMTLVLLLKFLSILLESVKYFWKKITGNDDYFSVLYNLVTFVNLTFFFIVIVLLGTGWSIVTPFIKGRVKYMIFLVLLLQLLNNIAIIVLSQETDGESSYQTWTGILHIVDILCCCAVLVPIVWQVNDLEKNAQVDFEEEENGTEREQLTNSENTSDDEHESDPVLSKLKLFRSFYLLVVSYIYSTRILVYLFSSVLSYKYVWVQNFMMEVITLAFYVMVGFLFRPKSESSQYQTLPQQQSIEEHGIAMTVTNSSSKTL